MFSSGSQEPLDSGLLGAQRAFFYCNSSTIVVIIVVILEFRFSSSPLRLKRHSFERSLPVCLRPASSNELLHVSANGEPIDEVTVIQRRTVIGFERLTLLGITAASSLLVLVRDRWTCAEEFQRIKPWQSF